MVNQESESTSGEQRSVVETYSIDVPGTARDGSLHLVERKTSTGARVPLVSEQRNKKSNRSIPAIPARVSACPYWSTARSFPDLRENSPQ